MLCSCSNSDTKFVIEGTVADTSCDGAQIFLVPLTEAATHETVDSVVIKDRHFRFEGNEAKIRSLRLQMPQRMQYQELLVYTEPGTIKAHIAQRGSVTGTKNNELLQMWKTTQEDCVAARAQLIDKYGTNAHDAQYIHAMDSLRNAMATATFNFLKQAGMNPLTRFFYMGNKGNLTPEQRQQLGDFEADYQHMIDSIRKANGK